MSKNQLLTKLNQLESLLKKKDDKPLNFKEACAYLGFRASYLYKLTSKKLITSYKPSGKMLFFSKVELEDWVFGRYGESEKEKARRYKKQEVKNGK